MNKLFLTLLLSQFTFFLSCSTQISKAKTIPLPELNNPLEIYANQDRLYITDSIDNDQRCTTVLVYSLKDYSLEFTLGGDGEGPGQYKMNPGHSVDYTKIGLYTPDGEFIKEIKTPGNSTIYHALGNQYVGRENIKENGLLYYVAYLYNTDLKRVKEIYRIENPYNPLTKKSRVLTRSLLYQTFNNKIYIKGKSEDFVIDVVDSTGTHIQTIQVPYNRDKVTDQHKDKVYENFKNHPYYGKYFEIIKKEIVFPEHLPAICNFCLADDKIYILTYHRREDKAEFYIIDLKGKLIKRMFVPFDQNGSSYPRFAALDGNIYQLRKNEESNQWELIITQLI
jgi:hypothetical protein